MKGIPLQSLSSWWLNQPIWKKICASQIGSGIAPGVGVNIKKHIWVATTQVMTPQNHYDWRINHKITQNLPISMCHPSLNLPPPKKIWLYGASWFPAFRKGVPKVKASLVHWILASLDDRPFGDPHLHYGTGAGPPRHLQRRWWVKSQGGSPPFRWW